MQIIEFFGAGSPACLIDGIARGDWRAAGYLANLLRTHAFERELGPEGKLYILLDGDTPVSFLTLTRRDCIDDDSLYPWIGFFYTFPAYRGRRLGGRLLDHASQEARRMGYARVYLATDHIGLYEKYGFAYLESRMSIWGGEERLYVRCLADEEALRNGGCAEGRL